MKKIVIMSFILISFNLFSMELGIDDAIKIADKNNLSIQKEKISLENSKTDVDITKKGLRPNLSGSLGLSDSEGADNLRYRRSLGLSYTIFNGGKNSSEIDMAENSYESDMVNFEKVKKEVYLELVKEFVSALKEKKTMEIYEKQLNEKNKEYERVKIRYENSDASKSEVLSIESSIFETETDIIESQNSYLISIERIKDILNTKDEISIKEPDVSIKVIDFESDQKIIVKENKDLEIKELAIESAKQSLKNEKGDYYPSISLGMSYDLSSDEFGDLLNNEELSVNLNLSYDIFSWGKRKDEVSKAENVVKESEIEYTNSKNSVLLDLKSKYLELKKYEKLIEAQDKKLQSYSQNFKIDQLKYENDELDIKDYLESENEYWSAKIALENLYLDYYETLYEYEDIIK